MENTNEKNTHLILLIFVPLIIVLISAGYYFRQELNISEMFNNAKERLLTSRQLSVKINLVASIGEKCLRVNYLVPCKNLDQKLELINKLPGIKHEMLMTLYSPEMIEFVEQRNFKKIKKTSLNTINNYSKETLKSIYVECFFFN